MKKRDDFMWHKAVPLSKAFNEESFLEGLFVGLVYGEAHHLALLDVVKSDNTDVAVGVRRAASLHFVQNFLGAFSAKHRELPHGPVEVLRRGSLVELNGREKAIVQGVLDLSVDLSIGQRRQIGECLEALLLR
jgi:hypothetical protein